MMKKKFLLIFSFLVLPLIAFSQEWEYQGKTPSEEPILSLEQIGDTIFGLSQQGVYFSLNEGLNWSFIEGTDEFCENAESFSKGDFGFLIVREDRTFILWDWRNGDWEVIFDDCLENQNQFYGKAIDDLLFISCNGQTKRSLDGGNTWEVVFEYKAANQYSQLHSFSNSCSAFYIADFRILYQSLDRGMTWDTIYEASDRINRIFCTDSVIFLRTPSFIYVSTDLGKNWEKKTADFLDYYNSIFTQKITSGILVSMAQTTNSPWLFFSQNIDGTWLRDTISDYSFRIGNIYDVIAIKNNKLLIASERGVCQMNTVGKKVFHSFRFFGDVEAVGDIKSIAAAGDTVFVKNGDFIWYKKNGDDDFKNLTDDLKIPIFTSTQLLWSEKDILVVNWPYLHYSSDSFQQGIKGVGNSINIESDGVYFYKKSGSYFRFKKKDSNLEKLETPYGQIQLWASQTSRLLMLKVTNSNSEGVYLSIDHGDTWIPYEPHNLSSPWLHFYDIVFFYKGKVFVRIGDKYYSRSIGGTGSWEFWYPQDWTTGTPFVGKTIFSELAGVLYAVVPEKGIFTSTESNGHFYPFLPNLVVKDPSCLFYDREKENFWIGDVQEGVFKLKLPLIENSPSNELKYRVFPTISSGFFYVVNENAERQISISIMDINGKLLFTRKRSQQNIEEINILDRNSGIYFVKIESEDYCKIHKIIKQ